MCKAVGLGSCAAKGRKGRRQRVERGLTPEGTALIFIPPTLNKEGSRILNPRSVRLLILRLLIKFNDVYVVLLIYQLFIQYRYVS